MAQIHPSAVVDKTAELDNSVIVGPNSVVGANCIIGQDTILDACVVLGNNVILGKGNQIYANAVIGKNPQLLGKKMDSKFGKLSIGNDNVIRENATIHPGMTEDSETKIGSNNLIMIGVHIGHDVTVEDNCVMSNNTQISGHCKIETGVWLSGMVALHQFVTIGKWAYAAGMSGINHDIPPFVIVSGHYPLEIRSINKRGLVRAGLTEEQQDAIEATFKKLYRNSGTMIDKAKTIFSESNDENVKAMCQTIIRSTEHRFGRYLEQFRH